MWSRAANVLEVGTPLSLEAWSALSEDQPGEWIDGTLVEEEMATHIHELVVGFLISVLRAWLVPRGGFVGGSEAKFVIGDARGRKPDVYAYFPGSRLPNPESSTARTPPDIMIEVVSSTPRDARRDRIEKLQEYAIFGVRYYWILDPGLRSLEILERGADGRYVHALDATDGQIQAIPGCQGLMVDLEALWSEVDRLIAVSSAQNSEF